MTHVCSKTCPLLGRILLSVIFVMSGGRKIFNWDQTTEQMANEGMVAIPVLLVGAILLELGGGLSVLFGFRARLGATALLVFLIPATLIFHDFWTYEGQEQQTQMINFMKNLSILGGILLILGFGAGPLSIDDRSAVASSKPQEVSRDEVHD